MSTQTTSDSTNTEATKNPASNAYTEEPLNKPECIHKSPSTKTRQVPTAGARAPNKPRAWAHDDITSNQQNTAHRRSKTHAPRNTIRQLGDGKKTKCWRRAHSHTKVLSNMANTRRTLPNTTCSVAPTHPHRHTHTHIHTQSHSHVHLPSHTPTLTPTPTAVTETHTHTSLQIRT